MSQKKVSHMKWNEFYSDFKSSQVQWSLKDLFPHRLQMIKTKRLTTWKNNKRTYFLLLQHLQDKVRTLGWIAQDCSCGWNTPRAHGGTAFSFISLERSGSPVSTRALCPRRLRQAFRTAAFLLRPLVRPRPPRSCRAYISLGSTWKGGLKGEKAREKPTPQPNLGFAAVNHAASFIKKLGNLDRGGSITILNLKYISINDDSLAHRKKKNTYDSEPVLLLR